MKRFFSFFCCLILQWAVYASPPSIARYAVVGETKDGSIAAFMLSHFGPSSHAPFATLIIKKAGEAEPLFQDGAYKMEGDETTLAQLISYLLEKNADILKNYEIDLTNHYLFEANMVFSNHNHPKRASGWVDIVGKGTKEFAIKSIQAENCPDRPNVIDLEFWFNGVNQLTTKQKADSCWDNSFSIRNIYQTEKALWFVINKQTNSFADQEVYFVDIQGIWLH